MNYKESWNSKKPQHLTIRENEVWKESGEALLEALKEKGLRFENSEQLIYALKVKDTDDFRYHPHINVGRMKIEGDGTLVFIRDVL